MATTIITKFGSGAPAASDVVRGELAVDTENGRLYTENIAGSVVEIGLNPSGDVDVTGTVTADGLTVESSGDPTSITLRHTGNTSGLVIKNFSGAESQLVNVDNGPMVFKTNDTERMRIDSTGNLRVGAGNTFEPTLQFTNSGRVVGNPGYSFSGDLDTGMFNPSAQGTIAFANNGAESMRIDSIGNVGIGTDSPVSPLTTSIGAGSAGSLNNQIAMTHSGASNSYHIKTIRAAADDEPAGLAFVENTTERMRIDSSGNLLVGKTSTSQTVEGIVLQGADGRINASADGNVAGIFNRLTDDGDIFLFRKDGTTVGSIGAYSSRMYVGTGDTGLQFLSSADNILPIDPSGPSNRDAAIDLGASGVRFKDLYLSGDVKFTDASSAINNTGGELYLIGSSNIRNQGAVHTFSNSAGSSEYARIDSSGTLLVGQTIGTIFNQSSETGVTAAGSGSVQATSSAGTTLFLNRLSSDGQIVGFYKDGAQVGSIGTNGGRLSIGSGDVNLNFNASANSMYPISDTAGTLSDGIVDIGASSARFKDLYLSGDAYVGQVKFPSVSYDDRSLGIDSNGFYLYNNDDSRYDLVVDDDGRLLIGKTVVSATGAGTELRGTQAIIGKTDSGTVNGIFFNHASTYVGGLNYSDTATSLQTSSDERLKENITDAEDAGSTIDAMQVRQFDWKVNGSHQDYGFIAQELEPVFDYAVHTAEDDMQTKSVDYASLVPMLVKEIQQLRARVAQLEGAN